MSLKELQEDFNNVIKPQLEEILMLLKELRTNNVTENIEAAAAKIITELKLTIQDCHCNKGTMQVLQQKGPKEEQIITTNDEPSPSTKLWRYSYPNFSVGNEDLGTGKNQGSLTWPFGGDKKKSS